MTTPNTSPSVELDDTTRAELERAGVIVSKVDFLYNWARGGSVWPLTFGLACCAIEMIASATSRFWCPQARRPANCWSSEAHRTEATAEPSRCASRASQSSSLAGDLSSSPPDS